MLLATSLPAFAADPFAGIWKPEPAKWKTSEGISNARKAELLVFEVTGKNTYRRIRKTPDGKQGSTPPEEWIVDGKIHKTATTPGRITRVGERHWSRFRTGSSGSLQEDFVVSPDNKTLTITRKGVGQASGRRRFRQFSG